MCRSFVGNSPISGKMPARRWVVQLRSVHGILLFLEEASLNMYSFFYMVSVSKPTILSNTACLRQRRIVAVAFCRHARVQTIAVAAGQQSQPVARTRFGYLIRLIRNGYGHLVSQDCLPHLYRRKFAIPRAFCLMLSPKPPKPNTLIGPIP